MNNIFIKNLTTLSKKNPNLAQRLQGYIPAELPKLVQENNNYNILYKNNLIHNSQNPLAEAQEIFNQAKNSPTSVHVVYGLGLGYLFQLTSVNSKGSVILYEPDLNILWLAFTLVDFSSDMLKNNVYITTSFEELAEAIHKNSSLNNTPTILSLPSQKKSDPESFENLIKKLQDLVGAFYLDLKFTKEKFYPSLKMLLKNIPNLVKEIPLINLKDCYKNKTAVVVSAGPTLDRNIEILKKYRDRFILITVGTALKSLYANDIKPDFLVIIETYNSSRQIEGLDLSDVNFITEPYSNPTLRNFIFKNVFLHSASNNPINGLWAEISGDDISEYFSKGTVSYTALNSARIMGFSKIILVGQDLAYIEGQCYSKESGYKDLYCEFNKEANKWEIVAKDMEKFADAISVSALPEVRERTAKRRLENLNKSLYYVKGIQGNMIPTESVYATFVKPLEEFTNQFNDREYINTSLVGAQINGFINIGLDEALQDTDPIKNKELDLSYEYNRQVFKNLEKKLRELIEFKNIICDGKKLVKNLNNDLKRYRQASQEVLKLLKKATMNYISLVEDFANKSKILNVIVTSDKIDIDYEMKMMQEFSIENIEKFNGKLKLFYENLEKKILEIEGIINESLNTTG